ncbi:hypothetical protein HCH_00272 [Hahella chejuensis KCTC 2396]|uniref:Uncharacterized protein n=1 Tax=Hahella chejuensis (strain KCTC 2396) TaxID=349521 RepID=Q2SQ89_HAHCH|nr:hypothetical protein HCH_00272 [Hahella chejuensis KCTC 2396]
MRLRRLPAGCFVSFSYAFIVNELSQLFVARAAGAFSIWLIQSSFSYSLIYIWMTCRNL